MASRPAHGSMTQGGDLGVGGSISRGCASSLEVFTDDRTDQTLRVERSDWTGCDCLPKPKHRDLIGPASRFGQFVGDENGGAAFLDKSPEPLEQTVGFGRGQHSRWLVENEDPSVSRERFDDFQ